MASVDRLNDAKAELSELNEKLHPLQLQYDKEKAMLDEVRNAKQKLQGLDSKMHLAESRGDVETVSDLRYDAIPGLEKRVRELEQQEAEGLSMLKTSVTPEAVAQVVARRTGIPVQKLSQTERERLLELGPSLRKRVVGQDEAADAVARAVLVSAAGLKS